MMTRIVGWFLETMTGGPLAKFEKTNERPFAAQEKRLRGILRENADTEYGGRFGFRSMAALPGTEMWKAFRKNVPIRSYADFLPEIERMKAGAENILIPGRPEMFSLTSGTTGKPKFCPVGPAFLRERQRQHLLWMRLIHKSHPSAAAGKYLVLSGPAGMGRTIAGIPCGTMGGQSVRTDAGEDRFDILLSAMAEESIRVVTAENPGALIALAKHLDDDADRLLDRLAASGPDRARKLREIRRVNGALTPNAVWPDLGLILTWQGGASKFYLPHVTALWGDAAMRCLGLRASEGIFSIPLRDNDASGVLAVGGHVMEFIPADSGSGDPGPDTPTLLAGQLEEGRLYRLVATTSGGLYRYDMGDLVRVTGFRGRTPEVRFERSAEAALSAAGEKLTEDQAVSAMETAAANGPLLNGFTLTHETVGSGVKRYVLALECTGGSDLSGGRGKRLRARLEQLLSVFDFELMKNNIGYNAGRQDGKLSFPRMVLLAEGSYDRLRGRLAAGGRPEDRIRQPTMVPPPGPGRAPVAGCPFFDHMAIAAEM